MDFSDLLRRRRMARSYTSEPIPQPTLERILSVIHHAPSAGNAQPHRVVVITDPELRRRLADVAEGWYLDHGHQPWLSQAPVHLVLAVREASYHERYQQPDKLKTGGTEIPWPVPFWWFDCGALFMAIHLAAINEGLGAGFYSPAQRQQLAALARIAELPEDTAIAGVITIGHKAPETRPVKPRPRLPLEEIVTRR